MKNKLLTIQHVLSSFMVVSLIILTISCEKESQIVLQEEMIANANDNLLKEDPPYFEIETWIYYIDGTFDCIAPATNCTIAIVRPKAEEDIIDFIENNKDGDFYNNAIAVAQNHEMLSTFIKDESLLKRIEKGELFVKFLSDATASYFLTLNEMENDYTSSNVFSVWKFNK